MSEQFPTIEKPTNPPPRYEITTPVFTESVFMAYVDRGISEDEKNNYDKELLVKQRDRFSEMFKIVGSQSSESELINKCLIYLEHKRREAELTVKKVAEPEDEFTKLEAKVAKLEAKDDENYLKLIKIGIEASRDADTGLYRRRGLMEVLQRLFQNPSEVFGEKLADVKGKDVTIMMTDLDDFGRFNKIYGNNTGDEVLRLYAEATKQGVRKSDLVGRWGGEEYVQILMGAGGDPHIIDARMSGKLKEFGDNEIPKIIERHKNEQTPYDADTPEHMRPKVVESVTFSTGAVTVDWDTLKKIFTEDEITYEIDDEKTGERKTLYFKLNTIQDRELAFKEIVLSRANLAMRRSKGEGKNTIRVAGSD